jgi:hypothetical protein
MIANYLHVNHNLWPLYDIMLLLLNRSVRKWVVSAVNGYKDQQWTQNNDSFWKLCALKWNSHCPAVNGYKDQQWTQNNDSFWKLCALKWNSHCPAVNGYEDQQWTQNNDSFWKLCALKWNSHCQSVIDFASPCSLHRKHNMKADTASVLSFLTSSLCYYTIARIIIIHVKFLSQNCCVMINAFCKTPTRNANEITVAEWSL